MFSVELWRKIWCSNNRKDRKLPFLLFFAWKFLSSIQTTFNSYRKANAFAFFLFRRCRFFHFFLFDLSLSLFGSFRRSFYTWMGSSYFLPSTRLFPLLSAFLVRFKLTRHCNLLQLRVFKSSDPSIYQLVGILLLFHSLKPYFSLLYHFHFSICTHCFWEWMKRLKHFYFVSKAEGSKSFHTSLWLKFHHTTI